MPQIASGVRRSERPSSGARLAGTSPAPSASPSRASRLISGASRKVATSVAMATTTPGASRGMTALRSRRQRNCGPIIISAARISVSGPAVALK